MPLDKSTRRDYSRAPARPQQAAYDAGLRYIAKHECGLLNKEIAYDEGVSLGTVRNRLSLARSMPGRAVWLWGVNFDTAQIARSLGLSEATGYNLLARARA